MPAASRLDERRSQLSERRQQPRPAYLHDGGNAEHSVDPRLRASDEQPEMIARLTPESMSRRKVDIKGKSRRRKSVFQSQVA